MTRCRAILTANTSTRTREKMARKSQDFSTALEFRRFENRVYRKFDQALYGPQLPLALAVRASLTSRYVRAGAHPPDT